MKGFRTLAVNGLTIAAFFIEEAEIVDLVPPGYEMHCLAGLALINALLRFLTTGPVPIRGRR